MIGEDRRLWWQIWNLFLVSLEICRAIIDDSLETIERVSRASMTDLCFGLIDRNVDHMIRWHSTVSIFQWIFILFVSNWLQCGEPLRTIRMKFYLLNLKFLFFAVLSSWDWNVESIRGNIQKILFQMEVSGFCDCVNARELNSEEKNGNEIMTVNCDYTWNIYEYGIHEFVQCLMLINMNYKRI